MTADVSGFIHDLRFDDLPSSAVEKSQCCLLDLLGVALAGTQTEMSRIARGHAVDFFGGSSRQVRLLFDGRHASASGAAMAGAMTIDSFDAHDGHSETKGHAGVTVLPALAAIADQLKSIDGREFLTCLVLGYEIGTRAGIALHQSSSDYHSSGAWNALAAAAIGARLLGLDNGKTRHALGIAEYHGPRGQMMRCIDHPTMVKDGSGWGAMAGVSAAYLAGEQFSGAPAITVEDSDLAPIWNDLGQRWRILEQYLKPYPVCRWAHPAIEATLNLVRAHSLVSRDIDSIEVTTFHQATRLAGATPTSTEEAQYSLPFSVAAALVHGEVGAAAITGPGLHDPEVLRLSARIKTVESKKFNTAFPGERWASVCLTRTDGRLLYSSPILPRGDPDRALSESDIRQKFRRLAEPVCNADRIDALEKNVAAMATPLFDITHFMDLILSPPS
jgi:2-methylcitrate dehydratase PrpD